MNSMLITGASGFIGSALYNVLKEKYEITALSSNRSGEGYTKINLLNTVVCKDFFTGKKFDVIIHTAAIAHGVNKVNKLKADQANTLMTKNIFDYLDVSDSKVIFLSSVAVYSYKNKGEYISVIDKPEPISSYGKSKLECEKIVIDRKPNSFHILRLSPVFTRNNLVDVKKRVVLPFLNKPFLTKNNRYYSLVELDNVVREVLFQINIDENTIRIVKDKEDYSQKEILSWFSYKEEEVWYINQKWIGGIKSFLSLFPFQKTDYIREMLHKLFYTVMYKNE